MLNIRFFYSLFLFPAVVLSACASAPVKEAPIFWPMAPEEPKIVYLGSYRGESDFRTRTLAHVLFGAPPASILGKPYGVFARDHKIYVTSTIGSVNITVFDTEERKISYIGNRGRARLDLPIGVAVASDGRIFVSDVNLKKIFVYDDRGGFKSRIGTDELVSPAGIAIDNSMGRLYVADTRGHQVVVYSLEGKMLLRFGQRGSGDGEFNFPTNIAVAKNRVYVVDTQNFRVQVFDTDGKFIGKFGQIGDYPGAFARPKGIAIDSEGHIYVVDTAFNNVQIFNDKGQLLLHFAQGGGGPGELRSPAGMHIDEHDRIYVTDQMNGRVLVFQYLSSKFKKEKPEEYRKLISPSEKTS